MDESETCECYVPKKTTSSKIIKTSNRRVTAKKKALKSSQPDVAIVPKAVVDEWERKNIYSMQWEIIESKLMNLSGDLFQNYVQDVSKFIIRYSDSTKIKFVNQQQVGFNCGLIPTAMIALNSTMTQMRFAKEVVRQLDSNNQSIKVLHLDAFNCSTKSNLFKEFFNSLVDNESFEANGFDRNEWKNMPFDEFFQIWLSSFVKPKRAKKEPKLTPIPLLIFIHDFENVSKQILVDLIIILKEYINNVPIILVFLLYNHLNSSIQFYLPSEATENLLIEDIRPFYEPKYIPQLLKEFVSDPNIRFKIHPKIIEKISSYITNYEFSFSNFIALLKGLAFDYFYENPISTICFVEDLEKKLQSDNHLLNVFQNSIPISGTDDAYVKNLIEEYKDMLIKHEQFTIDLQLILDLQSYCSLDVEDFITYYCQILSNSTFNFRENILYRFFRINENIFKSALEIIINKYTNKHPNNSLLMTMIKFKNSLKAILSKEKEEEESQLKSTKKLGLDCEVKIVKNKLRNLNSRSEWKQSIAPKNDIKRQFSAFEQWRIDLIDSLDSDIQQSFPSKYYRLIDVTTLINVWTNP
ncbi:hypothetical protein RDWZM_007540 [Blomia tropicalis]|uniref:Origin recognition complex subunit 3 N-terminal domain-containing protein n=1 Tax=Blomia tropicalis TaxID=40697 RepID=A0A9Q0RI34_BLOTA|nr:hypothetical protein RDWZM_007540 [Blomia tropicalis]